MQVPQRVSPEVPGQRPRRERVAHVFLVRAPALEKAYLNEHGERVSNQNTVRNTENLRKLTRTYSKQPLIRMYSELEQPEFGSQICPAKL